MASPTADERAAWRQHAWHMRQLCDFVWFPDRNVDAITALKKGAAGLDLLLDVLTADEQRAAAMLGNDALVVERLREQNAKLIKLVDDETNMTETEFERQWDEAEPTTSNRSGFTVMSGQVWLEGNTAPDETSD